MESSDRRDFLKKSAASTAGILVGAAKVAKSQAKSSANDTINVAVAGIRSRALCMAEAGTAPTWPKFPGAHREALRCG